MIFSPVPDSVKEIIKERWHIGQMHPAELCLALLDDEGNRYNESACWFGYFESLYGAEITNKPEDGWSFKL